MDPETWLLLALAMLIDRGRTPATAPRPPGKPAAKATPPLRAYIYRLPRDSDRTVRMAYGPDGGPPREMGIFGTEAKALEIAREKGWTLAWQGVRDLEAVPL